MKINCSDIKIDVKQMDRVNAEVWKRKRELYLRSLLSTIFIDTRNPKPTPIPILFLTQLIYQYNSTRYTIYNM